MSRPTYAEEAKSLLRTRILGAVHDLLHERTWKKVSMSAVAAGAGVSRQTVYNEFDDRDRLAEAYVLWQADAVLDAVAAAMFEYRDDLVVALRVGLEVYADTAITHPMLRAVAIGDEADGLLAWLSTPGGSPIVELSIERLTDTVRDAWPAVDADHVRPVIAMLVRVVLSQAAMPSTHDPLDADTLAVLVTPYLASL